MRPPRIAILVLFFSASLFLVCRSISTLRRPSTSAISSPPKKSAFRSFFSFTAPFSLFPPSAAISLTEDNSTFFPARPAAFGPPLPGKGLSGQLWIGSGFSDETLQEGESEGELGCSDIPGWEDRRSELAVKVALHESTSNKPDSLAAGAKSGKKNVLGNDPTVGRNSLQKKRQSQQNRKPVDDGTDDYLHESYRRPRGPYDVTISPRSHHHADIQSMQETAEITGKVALLSRGGCGFLEKVKWAQRRGAIALIVGDNQKGGPLIQMFARGNTDNVSIPSVFTSRTTAHLLSSLIQPGSFIEDIGGNKDPVLKVHRPAKAGKETRSNKPALSAKFAASGQVDSTPKAKKPITTKRGWFSRLFHWGSDLDVSSDKSRPPSSGRLDWASVDDRHSENGGPAKYNPDRAEKAAKKAAKLSSKVSSDSSRIGGQSWRDSDDVGMADDDGASDSQAFTSGNSRSSNSGSSGKQSGKAGKNSATEANGFRAGSNTPGSGEYKPGAAGNTAVSKSGKPQLSSGQSGGFLSGLFGGSKAGDQQPDRASSGEQRTPTTTSTPAPTHTKGSGAREGLWVTITPTGSASPFFDTLLVLVISPLITLTVVYALLILRVKIRMRRWRAPKSVVDRLPVRTYQAAGASPTPTSRSPSPPSPSPTTPLLQGSSRARPRSHTSTGVPETASSLSADDAAQAPRPPSHEKNSRGGSSQWRKYMGRQKECVVCLEEYVDGVSRVMSLPCGHEFHAECITPWLTTRRRTCPICKSDVVRSLARGTASGPQYEPFREDDDEESNDESSEMFQDEALSPNHVDDLERGSSSTQGSGQDWRAARNDVWFGALTSRLGGGGSSFTPPREGSNDRAR